eukprot:GHVO01049801.1.p1 GENE.GHVO01049801.1~~GHVO01049801.1.p1  ORF type:complete len:113 (-),score=19.05 GHVO01049801.1:188-526(-)
MSNTGGAHCQLDWCRQLDFLPFTCPFCGKEFCLDHRQPNEHECPFENASDRRVMVCPKCHESVPLNPNMSTEEQQQQHEASGDCQPEVTENKKKRKEKCVVQGCRESNMQRM